MNKEEREIHSFSKRVKDKLLPIGVKIMAKICHQRDFFRINLE